MDPSHVPARDPLPTLPMPEFDPPSGGEPATAAHLLDTLAHLLTVGGLAVALAVLLGYAVLCAVSPYRVCPRCHGRSRLVAYRGVRGQRLRAGRCRRCHGFGLRLRLGRRAWNRLSRFRHARRATRRGGPWRDGRPGPDSF